MQRARRATVDVALRLAFDFVETILDVPVTLPVTRSVSPFSPSGPIRRGPDPASVAASVQRAMAASVST